jgi:hypothetical protein
MPLKANVLKKGNKGTSFVWILALQNIRPTRFSHRNGSFCFNRNTLFQAIAPRISTFGKIFFSTHSQHEKSPLPPVFDWLIG